MSKHMISLAALCTFLVPLCASADDSGELKAREQAAKQASAAFMEELKGELTTAMKEGGPANAIQVCTDKAPAVAGERLAGGPGGDAGSQSNAGDARHLGTAGLA